jgi:hypothetical protein
MPACEAQNPAKRFKPPTFCNWLTNICKPKIQRSSARRRRL